MVYIWIRCKKRVGEVEVKLLIWVKNKKLRFAYDTWKHNLEPAHTPSD